MNDLLSLYIKMQSLAYCTLNFSSVEEQNKAYAQACKAWDSSSVTERDLALKSTKK